MWLNLKQTNGLQKRQITELIEIGPQKALQQEITFSIRIPNKPSSVSFMICLIYDVHSIFIK